MKEKLIYIYCKCLNTSPAFFHSCTSYISEKKVDYDSSVYGKNVF